MDELEDLLNKEPSNEYEALVLITKEIWLRNMIRFLIWKWLKT